MRPLRLGVLGSGKGSNYRAIQDAIDAGQLRAETRIVVSDVEDARILELAASRGVRARYFPPGKYRTRLEPDIEQQLADFLASEEVELVVLAGFMRMLKAPMLEAFPNRIINIHPSLLPKFPGMAAWEQALAAGEETTGCTVHYIDAGMDTGEIIAQREVPIVPGDTASALHARIQQAEHALYSEVIARIARRGEQDQTEFPAPSERGSGD